MAQLFLLGYFAGEVEQLVVVSLAHVGETRARGEVLATKRMFGEEIDVIGDEHHVADAHFGREATRCVGDKERFNPQFIHDTDGEGYLLHVVTFVVVEASLHGKYFFSAQSAEQEATGVTFDRRNGKMRDVGVGKLLYHFDFLCQAAETCAEHDGYCGVKGGVAANPLSSGLDLL